MRRLRRMGLRVEKILAGPTLLRNSPSSNHREKEVNEKLDL